MRSYTRSLDDQDYGFLEPYVTPLVLFLRDMANAGVPHREWHPHRLWEYGSMLQQLDELRIPTDARLIDVGSGGCFFAPYLAQRYPHLELTDSMTYGDVTAMVQAQREYYGVALPLHDLPVESMASIADQAYDVTMCISTIEHVAAEFHDAALRELWRITKPGGYLFLTSDYFRDHAQFQVSPSRHLQHTAYTKEFVLSLPKKIPATFVGLTDLDYRGDFVHTYSFCNICLRKDG